MENKMKNTNIDCIGAIPIEWDVKPLKYLVRQPITDGPHETRGLQRAIPCRCPDPAG